MTWRNYGQDLVISDEWRVAPEKLTLELIDVDAIPGFLNRLVTSRHNSA